MNKKASNSITAWLNLPPLLATFTSFLFVSLPVALAQSNFYVDSGAIDKKFGTFTILTTHNSYCSPPDFTFSAPVFGRNQNNAVDIIQQLNDGIRGVEIDLIEAGGNVCIAHGVKSIFPFGNIGRSNAHAVFQSITDWLNSHPNELLLLKLQIENEVTNAQVLSILQATGILEKIYVFSSGQDITSMTPRDILESPTQPGKQIITLGTSAAGANSNFPQYATSNQFDNNEISDLDPTILFGLSADGFAIRPLYTISAYVTTGPVRWGNEGISATVNQFSFLKNLVLTGWQEGGKRPYRVIVDYHTRGAPLAVINDLNDNYNAIRGRILNQTGSLYNSIDWQNTFEGSGFNTATYGVFSFPVRQNTTTVLRPQKPAGFEASHFVFSPPSVTMTNIAPHSDREVTFRLVDLRNQDSDNDGLSDFDEDPNGNGIVDSGETDLNNPDSDSDGVNDGLELAWNLNPLIHDSLILAHLNDGRSRGGYTFEPVEGFTLGSINGQNGWLGNGQARISNTDAFESTQSLELSGSEDSNATRTIDLDERKQVWINFDAKLVESQGELATPGTFDGPTTALVALDQNSRIACYDSSTSTWVTSENPIDSSQWHHLEIFLDYGNNLWQLSLNDGDFIISDLSFVDTEQTALSYFRAIQYQDQTGSPGRNSYIDNLDITVRDSTLTTTGYARWVLNYVDNGAADGAGPVDDLGNTGIPNIIAYIFDVDPTDGIRSIALPKINLIDSSGNNYLQMVITHRNDDADITIIPEVSTDLSTWNRGTEHIQLISSLDNGNKTTTFTYRSIATLDDKNKLFMRYRVE